MGIVRINLLYITVNIGFIMGLNILEWLIDTCQNLFKWVLHQKIYNSRQIKITREIKLRGNYLYI